MKRKKPVALRKNWKITLLPVLDEDTGALNTGISAIHRQKNPDSPQIYMKTARKKVSICLTSARNCEIFKSLYKRFRKAGIPQGEK
ncbi:MAG: hypothetical protein GTO55_01005 [Armatimonadetes bacterium]|nr:hypothetical protein [Armatimonadota bacterium]NIM22862.1 hypothetical protein [Armatimonadota bacterium]NIM66728.1 hypothetical protein [Armatimonadota bacterium]NIM75285.1 hypothetical protein [Armatimonadota bacterium]NIN04925.1 hypothetical protein [Armatimonadota bacterium]